jgi:hypothetical protein
LLRRIFGSKREEVAGSFITWRVGLIIKYYWGDQVKGHEMGVTCIMHDTDENCKHQFRPKRNTWRT